MSPFKASKSRKAQSPLKFGGCSATPLVLRTPAGPSDKGQDEDLKARLDTFKESMLPKRHKSTKSLECDNVLYNTL